MPATSDDLPDFDAWWDYDHPDETEVRFRDLLPQAQAKPAYHAELLTQIARTQGLQHRFEDAHRTLDRVKGMLSTEMKRAKVRYLLERGRVFNSSRQKALALPLFQKAWQEAGEIGEDFFAVDAAHMLAIAAPPEEALRWNLDALALAEKSEKPRARKWLGSLYNNIGWTYHDRGDFAQALEFFEKAQAWREEHGQEKETRIARWCVARALRSLEQIDQAYQIQRELLAEYQALDEQPGYVNEELGECLLLMDRAEDARSYFQQAYEILSKDPWLAEAEPGRIERLRHLSQQAA